MTGRNSGRRHLRTPLIRWTRLVVTKQAGFTDTKPTGRPGWDTIWHGWYYLQARA
ncbi:MAG: hypothetical protein IPJ33_19080 [Gammaproteobacteria bacterium]|nr:hypothetical protein [Gammaproteobacteria bacterium]MBP6051565.1 hypothetical protein [Pseudomonadales bacterium]MBK6581330.1 hypothetical protein [Gammaproteobacteria bacterium]MBK7167859.1 hypothetical protein [Gammaproteobacteria bacterium]MBK7518717.1 hypothetical protein [Gammaproteobacteria bacterium]